MILLKELFSGKLHWLCHCLFNYIKVYVRVFCYAALFAHPALSYAGPNGGNVVGGSGSINQSGLTTNINQSSQSMAIDWQSYNLDSNEIVNYLQSGASSLSLNRILGGDASKIHGQINANGQVILVNPNGIFFGQNASINVGGLIASGLDIDPVDFMNGDFIFKEVIGADGTVINSGLINASLGGSVALLGKQVKNEGVINAKLGAVSLAAGKEAVLTFDNQGLIGVRVTKEILQDELGVDPAVLNSGEINANGGRVLLTGSVSRDVFSEAVNHDGLEQATSVVVNEDGSFTLGGGADVVNIGEINVSSNGDAGDVVILGNNVTHTGTIKADSQTGTAGMIELQASDTLRLEATSLISATAQNNKGGQIKLLGNKVGLFDQSEVDASGQLGGGEILIGGDFQGKNDRVSNARVTYVGEETNIRANANHLGDGGEVIVWADHTTRYYGHIEAKGGDTGGDGGFAEVSGKKYLGFEGSVDLSAEGGDGGTLLLDPDNITIQDGGSANVTNNDEFSENSGNDVMFDADQIRNILNTGPSGTHVVLQANQDILVNEAITGVNDPSNLTLEAGDDIQINENITLDGGSLTITSNASGCDPSCGPEGGVSTLPETGRNIYWGSALGVELETNGGDVTLEGDVILIGNVGSDTSSGSFTIDGNLNADSGMSGRSILLNSSSGTIGVDIQGSIGDSERLGDITILNADDVILGTTLIGGVSANSLIVAQSNSFTTNNSTINTTSAGAAGGDVTINAVTTINTGSIITSGASGATGMNGGNITLAAEDITVASLDTRGGSTSLTLVNGGGGGAIDISATEDTGTPSITLNGNIQSAGGASTNAIPGAIGTTGMQTVELVGPTGGNLALGYTGTFTEGLVVDGSAGSDTLTANNTTNTWNMASANGGTLAESNVTFTNFENLVGGSGTDTLNGTNGANDWILTGPNAGTINAVLAFSNIETLNGGTGADTLTGPNSNNSWDITAPDAGTVAGVSFTSMQNLTGGNLEDEFSLNGGSLTGSVNGGAGGTNTLIGGNGGVTFTLTGNDAGSIAGITSGFSNIGNLTGGTGNDSFILNSGNTLSGQIDGVSVSGNSITRNTGTNNWVLTALHGGTLTATGGFSNIQTLNGGGGTDTITGIDNQGNTWTVDVPTSIGTVANTASLTDLVIFTGMENLTGGSDIDAFEVTGMDFIGTGLVIDGGNQPVSTADTLNLSAMTGNVDVLLGSNVSGIEAITAGGTNTNSIITGQTIDGANTTNTWQLFDAAVGAAGVNDGNVTNENGTTTFIDFSEVNGSDRDDNFEQTTAGVLGYAVDGLTGTDSIDLSSLSVVDINVGASFGNGIVGIEGVIGNGTDSTINGSNAGETWDINGNNTGTIGTLTFTDFNIINAGSGNDIFNVSGAGAISGPAGSGIFGNGGIDTLNVTLTGSENNGIALFDGGVGADTVNLIGAAAGYDSASYNANNGTAVAGITYQVAGSNYTVNFLNAETINDDIQAANLVINGTSSADTIGLSGASYIVSNVSQTFATVDFTNKTNVSIVGGAGNDIAQLNSNVNLGTGSLTFETEDVVGGVFTVTSQDLILDGVSSVGVSASPLLTDVDNLQISNVDSSTDEIYIQETNGINLVQAGTAGLLNIVSNNGDIDDSTTLGLISGATIDLTASNGDINLDNSDNNLTGTVSLSTPGTATFNNSGSSTTTSLGTVNADNLIVTSLNADILNAGGAVVVSNNTMLDAANNDVSLTSATNNFSTIEIIAANADLVDSNNINLGASTLTGDLSINLSSGNLTDENSTAIIVGGTSNLDVAGDITLDSNSNNFSTVNIINAQNVTLTDSNAISLQSTNIAGDLSVTANGNINNAGALSVNGNSSLIASANSDITLDDSANTLAGTISLAANTGNLANVTLDNVIDTNLAALTVTDDLSISSGGNLTQTGAFTVGDTTTLTASGQNITLDQANNLDSLSITAANNATINNGNNDLRLNQLVVNNDLSLEAMTIIDGNGGSNNIQADKLTIRSVNGIGENDELESQVAVMDVINSGSGDIRFSQQGDVEFIALQNANSSGTINMNSDGDYYFNPGSVDANRLQGALEMSTDGNFFGVGDADLNNADVTAFSATFFSRGGGAFGTPIRPIILDVPKSGNVLIQTSTTSFDFSLETPDDLVSEGVDLSILGSALVTAGDQLVEIESLSEVDPAIFTALSNYSQEEIAIRLPRDQLYEDDLEDDEATQ